MGRERDRSTVLSVAQIDRTGVVRAHAEVPDENWIASFELLGEGWRGRARHGAPAPSLDGGFGVSAPLLVSEAPKEPGVLLSEVILPTTEVRNSRSVPLYFEIYGAARGEELEMSVTLSRTGGTESFFARIGRVLGFGSDRGGATKVTWADRLENVTTGYAPRFLNLDIGEVEPGQYTLTLRVLRSNGISVLSERTIRYER
jgi:hypothetical protein